MPGQHHRQVPAADDFLFFYRKLVFGQQRHKPLIGSKVQIAGEMLHPGRHFNTHNEKPGSPPLCTFYRSGVIIDDDQSPVVSQ